MHKDVKKKLLTQKEIRVIVYDIGEQIKKKHSGKEVVFVVILKGAFVFAADLMREVSPDCDVRIVFMKLSSYGNKAQSSGNIKVLIDIEKDDVKGKNVLIIEDIADEGSTLKWLINHLKSKKPKSVETCVLLDKFEARKVAVELNYVGEEISNEFVVGYGLDYAQKYRGLPYVGILKKEIYS